MNRIDPDTTWRVAQANHQRGDLSAAVELYRKLVSNGYDSEDVRDALAVALLQANDPHSAIIEIQRFADSTQRVSTLTHLAVAHSNIGQHEIALGYSDRAIELDPNDADAHFNHAKIIQAKGDQIHALAAYERTCLLRPGRFDAHFNAANLCRQMGRLEEAEGHYRAAIRSRDSSLNARKCLAKVLGELGRWHEAIDYLRQILHSAPEDAATRIDLVHALIETSAFDEAEQLCGSLLGDSKCGTLAQHGLVHVLRKQGKLDDAICLAAKSYSEDMLPTHVQLCDELRSELRIEEAFSHATTIVENYPYSGMAFNCLGLSQLAIGQPCQAIQSFRKALVLSPGAAEVTDNLGVAYILSGDTAAALQQANRAIILQPDLAQGHLNLAYALLREGRFQEGWREMEWRRISSPAFFPEAAPSWDGRNLPRGTILVQAEQGIGDVVQFARFLKHVADRCHRVVLRCPKHLHPLLSTLPHVSELVADEAQIQCDAVALLMSIPALLGLDVGDFSSDVPYLMPDARLQEKWRDWLPNDCYRVGVAWQGNKHYANDVLRSIPLNEFELLADVEGATLFSLQPVESSETGFAQAAFLRHCDLEADQVGAFLDTAALMSCLDLIICSDSAVAHVAGALGCEVWLILGYSPDWRWMMHRDDTPWYPRMRLFRQHELHEWNNVFKDVASTLCQRIRRGTGNA